MATRRERGAAPGEASTFRPTPGQKRWLMVAVAIGLVLYPALTGTLGLFDSELADFLPAPPDFAGGVLNYSNLVSLAVFAFVWWCLYRAGLPLSAVGFPTRWRWWQLCLLGVLIAYVVFLLVVVALPQAAASPSPPPTLSERLGYIFITAVRAGVVEETLFRGLALTYLPGLLFRGRVWPAVLVSTVAFVFAHGEFSVSVILVRTGLALVFSALFLWRRSLRLPIILHWLWDALTRAAIP